MLPRFVQLPDDDSGRVRFIPLEDLIANHLDDLFPGMEILEHHVFRVTRNEDVEIDEDETENLIQALEKELLRRRFGPPIRLEITDDMDAVTLELLVPRARHHRAGGLPAAGAARPRRPVRARQDRPPRPASTPSTCRRRPCSCMPTEPNAKPDIFASDRARRHPAAPPVRVVRDERAGVPRAGRGRPERARHQADALPHERRQPDRRGAHRRGRGGQAGARPGRDQGALRRAEQHHLGAQAREGRRARGLRPRRAEDPLQARAGHPPGEGQRSGTTATSARATTTRRRAASTKTSACFTADDQVGKDLTRLFNELSGYAIEKKFKRLLVAPLHLRKGLLKRIAVETENARGGQALRHPDQDQLDRRRGRSSTRSTARARPACRSTSGCAASARSSPGSPGLSENIRVRCILGRYLEHSRIFSFANDGDPQVFIGSADMMHRNLDRRVEALVRLVQPEHLDEIDALFDLAMSRRDRRRGGSSADGVWTRHAPRRRRRTARRPAERPHAADQRSVDADGELPVTAGRRPPSSPPGAVCWRLVDGRVARPARSTATHHRDVSLPKGKVDPGETLPQTAVREIHEETGLPRRARRAARHRRVRAARAAATRSCTTGRPRSTDDAIADADASRPTARSSASSGSRSPKARAKLTYEHDAEIARPLRRPRRARRDAHLRAHRAAARQGDRAARLERPRRHAARCCRRAASRRRRSPRHRRLAPAAHRQQHRRALPRHGRAPLARSPHVGVKQTDAISQDAFEPARRRRAPPSSRSASRSG